MDAALYYPAAERNAEPIWQVLSGYLADCPSPYVLEIASGSGQHGAGFCARHAHLRWQPTDVNSDALASIAARRGALPAADQARLLAPMALDVLKPLPESLSGEAFTHVLAINMIHIAPFSCCEGLFALADALWSTTGDLKGGKVITYGPYFIAGQEVAPSNLAFDRSLKAQSPEYGIRQLADVSACAARYGFTLLANHSMPANNNLLVFSRS